MSSLTRPTGPENQTIYWIRRAMVLIAALLVLALLLWIFSPRDADSVATVPSQSSSATATDESPSSEPSSTPTPTASSDEPATPSASEEPKPASTAQPSQSASAPSSSTPSPSAPAKPATCKPADLRVTLTGPGSIKAAKVVEFELSVINGGSSPCTLTVNSKNLVLKIYSGTDRIWSTEHCAKWVPTIGAELKPEQATTWSMAWPGKRSAAECKIRDDAQPRSGTYVVTAELSGAKPVQHVMKLS